MSEKWYDFMDLMNKPISKTEEIYWMLRRTLAKVHPKKLYREVKWFIQRGKRGWSDRDTWSFDGYLAKMIPEALAHLRDNKMGVPAFLEDENGKLLYCMNPPIYCTQDHETVPHSYGVKLVSDGRATVIQNSELWAWKDRLHFQAILFEDAEKLWNIQLTKIIDAYKAYIHVLDTLGSTEQLQEVKKKMSLLILYFENLWD